MEKIKIDFKRIRGNGFPAYQGVEKASALLYEINDSIDYLATHNKNYTKKQEAEIIKLQFLMRALYTEC